MHLVRYIKRDFCAIDDGNSDDLEIRFRMGQGYWKLHQWIPHESFPISHF